MNRLLIDIKNAMSLCCKILIGYGITGDSLRPQLGHHCGNRSCKARDKRKTSKNF